MTSLPSYADYGTYDESAHPDLWDGVVGYWAPCLGPTGLRLHDVGRGGNWGTLTNMTAADDWVIDAGQYALDFDGTNDLVNAGTTGGAMLNGPPLSVAAWVNARSLGFGTQGVISRDQTSPFAFSFRLAFGTPILVTDGANLSASSAISLNAWTHLMVSLGPSFRAIYINGVLSASSTAAYTITSNTDNLYIGADFTGTASDRLFNGLISDVIVWRRTLTPNHVRQNYQLGRGGMLERRRRRRVYVEQAGFRGHYRPQRAQLIGGGVK